MRAIVAGFLILVGLAVVPSTAPGHESAPGVQAYHVVILNSTDPYLPAFLAVDSALRDAVNTGSNGPVDFYAEALDMHRFPQTRFDSDIAALLQKKYQDIKIDVVVAAASLALDFAERHGGEIWPGARIVYHSVPVDWLQGHRVNPTTIGVPVRLGFADTIDLALRLRPDTRQVAVVAGTADPDLRHLALTREALQRYEGRLDVQFLDGLTLADTLATLQALPPDALVFYLTMFRDGAGIPMVPREVLSQIALVSPAPVFGVFETYLGKGIVAGAIASYSEQGRRAGELVAEVLNGNDAVASNIEQPAEPRCMADWQQIRRWGIDRRQLPPDCEIRFREITAWDRYHWQILVGLAVILLQTVLIFALVLSRRRYRDARVNLSDELVRRVEAESLAARLRGRLGRFSRERSLGTMATAISHEINQPLIAIQNYAQAAKRRLDEDVVDIPKLAELFAKIEGQAERAGAITQRVRSLVNNSEIRLQPVAPESLIDEVIRLMEPEAVNRGCRIDFHGGSDLPPVLADPLQIQLVLVNLLHNAMKVVGGGEAYDKRVGVEAEAGGGQEVVISVRDRGPGVPPDRVTEIFEPLYSGAGGGMGMGLAISLAIVEAHGGRLWYEPDPDGGAVFRFTLRISGS